MSDPKRKQYLQMEKEVEEYCDGDWAMYLKNTPSKIPTIKMMFQYKFGGDRMAFNEWARENGFRAKDFDVVLGPTEKTAPAAHEESTEVGAFEDISAQVQERFGGDWMAFLEAIQNPVSILAFLLRRHFGGRTHEFRDWARAERIRDRLVDAVVAEVEEDETEGADTKRSGGIVPESVTFGVDTSMAKPTGTDAPAAAAPPRPAPKPESGTAAPDAGGGEEVALKPEDYLVVLAAAFPSLANLNPPGLSPWTPEALDAWAAGEGVPEEARHAAAFLLSLGSETVPRVGRFDVIAAFHAWPEEDREVFRAWARTPLFPVG